MQAPTTSNTFHHSGAGVRYNILAFRRLTRDEMILQIQLYLSQAMSPTFGQSITITTRIGADERMHDTQAEHQATRANTG